MSEISEIRELGETAYGGYCQASGGKSLVSGASLPLWDEQAPEIRQAWNLAAMAVVDRWQQAGEDAPGTGPQPAKVIVVTETPIGDRAPVERRYTASQWDDSDYSRLRLIRSGHPVGSYQAGAWLSVREDGAEVPDATARALGIARRALEEIAKTVLEADDPRREVVRVARDAAEEIFTETEL